MARRRRDDGWDKIEAIIKSIFGGFLLLALGVGGVGGFARTFNGLVSLALAAVLALVGIGVLVLIGIVCFKFWKRRQFDPSSASSPPPDLQPYRTGERPPPRNVTLVRETVAWTVASIREALGEIDWYQFEKFCAALLRADGFSVERKGGAQPDGGVDLIVEKAGTRALIQCKHWRTWVVQERVIREMLGSMTHFKVSQGAIYTLKGWTAPAHRFATEHAITLVNGDELAQSAATQLNQTQLEELLRPREHHCPKCESPMVFRKGNFTSFWGCSRYPACRGKFNHSGAR